MIRRLLLAGALLAIAGGHARAESVAQTRIESTTAAPTQTQTSGQLRGRAQDWGLTEGELRRYQELMGGIRGSLSVAGISPVEVLGIHARNDDERRRYAELWARLRHEDAERVLAFERAYQEAARRLFPEPAIDHARLDAFRARSGKTLERMKGTALQAGDRIMLFALPGCSGCDAAAAQAVSLIRQREDVGLDVYVLDTAGEDGKVRAWAQSHGIDPNLIKDRRITLNHDAGTLKKLTGRGVVPYAAVRRGDRLMPYPELTAK